MKQCKWLVGLVLFSHLMVAMAQSNGWGLNMPEGVTPISHQMYWLHMVAIDICAVIGLIVFGVMFYALIFHRKSRGYVPARFHDHPTLEIVWSVIPFVILVALAIPATRVLIQMENTADADVTIKIIGSQWQWQYQYLNEGISFYSVLSTPFDQIQNKKTKGEWYLLEVDKPLVLPIQKKIRFLVTSQDVVHSWWVPELGIKRDAIPGYMYEAWAWIEKPGTYRGQCAELCGVHHAYMPIVVQALPEVEYQAWIAAQPKVQNPYGTASVAKVEPPTMTRQQLMAVGKKKYNDTCAACHLVHGEGMPPLYPALKSSSIAIGKPISRHINMILHGIPGTAMQPYKEHLSDIEIAAIVTYERNAWGNQTGDVVQPVEVARLRATIVGDGVHPKM